MLYICSERSPDIDDDDEYMKDVHKAVYIAEEMKEMVLCPKGVYNRNKNKGNTNK